MRYPACKVDVPIQELDLFPKEINRGQEIGNSGVNPVQKFVPVGTPPNIPVKP